MPWVYLYTLCPVPRFYTYLNCLLRRVQVKEAALLLAAVGASKVRAASCCGGCGRRWLRCCLLRWVLAKKAALLLAAVGAGEGGCAAACCGGCMRRRLRCCLLRCGCWRRRLRCCLLRWVHAKTAALLHAVVGAGEAGCAAPCRATASPPTMGGGGGGFTVADAGRWVGANEAARLYCCLLLWVQRDGLRCGMMW